MGPAGVHMALVFAARRATTEMVNFHIRFSYLAPGWRSPFWDRRIDRADGERDSLVQILVRGPT
jgi:hypothetical protein